MSAISIDRIRVQALTCAVPGGPLSSLGAMPTRNGVLVEVTTADGCVGWGEAWCNFPPGGGVAKVRLLRDVIGPQVLGTTATDWRELRPRLETTFARMIIHTGEPGPFSHCLAALDMALADIAARLAGLPLARFLDAGAAATVPVYASTPDVTVMAESIGRLVEAGHNAVKLKVGFDAERDEAILSSFRRVAPPELGLMVDANQNWSGAGALEAIARLKPFGLEFIEEPIRADATVTEWAELGAKSPVPLAAGENILAASRFAELVEAGGLQVVQPDVAKWGGISGALEVGRHARAHGAVCAMHYMGTALGLAASLHTLAAIGGSGWVELDANPNPLRTDLGALDFTVSAGRVVVPATPGIGFVPDAAALAPYIVAACDLH